MTNPAAAIEGELAWQRKFFVPACSCILIYVIIIFYASRKIKEIKNEDKHLSYCVLSLGIVYLLIVVNLA